MGSNATPLIYMYLWLLAWSNFLTWGQKNSGDFMIPNDTEQTTENISLVGQGIQQKFRFFENFVSLDLWSKMKKINHAGMVKISDFRSKDFRWFYGSKWYKTDSWRQVISRDWVYNKKFQIYCEFGFLVQNEKNRTFGQIFQIWGQQIFHDFMASNDTERTTEDILSVDTGYTKNIFRFIENFVRLDFWSPKKNRPCRYMYG